MTTDTKQPPDTDRLVLAILRRGGWCHARWLGDAGWSIPGVDDNADWREVPEWDRLAILDRYDEERKEWEAQIADLTEGMNSAIAHAVVERKKLNAAEARADSAEKERDEARARLADTGRALNPFEEIEVRRRNMELDGVFAERDRAIAERDALIVSRDEQFMRANKNAARVDEAIRERDELGCQLEALRSVQRGDVADLRTRMESLEEWRSWVMGDDQVDEHPFCASAEEWDRIRQLRCAESDRERIKTEEVDDDEKGGA